MHVTDDLAEGGPAAAGAPGGAAVAGGARHLAHRRRRGAADRDRRADRGCERSPPSVGLTIGVVGHAGDGNMHPTIVFDRADPDQRAAGRRRVRRDPGRRAGAGRHGHRRARRRPDQAVDLLAREIGPVGLEVHRAIKGALDPAGLFNPGKVFRRAARATSRCACRMLSCPARPGRDRRRERRAAGRHRRRRRRHVGGVAGPPPARCRRPGDRRPRAGAARRPTRPAASPTGSAAWSPTATSWSPARPRSSRAQDIDVRTGTRADGDRPRRPGTVVTAPARRDRLGFDHLVVATGGRPVRPPSRASTPPASTGCTARRRRGAPRPRSPARGEAGRRGRRRLHRAGDGRGAARRGAWRSPSSTGRPLPMAHLRPRHGRAGRATPCGPMGIDLHTGEPVREIETDAAAGRGPCVTDAGGYPGRPRRARPRRAARTSRWPEAGLPLGATGGDRRRPPHAQPVAPEVWAAGDCVRDRPPGHRRSRCTSRSARTPTSRAGSPASTSAAATPRFPG